MTTKDPRKDPNRYTGPAGALRRMADGIEDEIKRASAEAAAFRRRAEARDETIAQKRVALEEITAAIARLEQGAETSAAAARDE